MRNFQDYIKYSVRKEAEISDVGLLLEFLNNNRMISLLHRSVN
jgi:hypothetical protein